MASTRICELVSARSLSGASIDEAAGVIRSVAVCGERSANGRRYPAETMKRDYRRYEGVSVNFDHVEGTGSRKFDDRGGWLANLRLGPDGRPRADLHLLTTDPRSAKVFELARRNPSAFGLSHVAHCQTRFEGGIEVVESIESVESVDIVADPATNKGLFEARTGRPAPASSFDVNLIPSAITEMDAAGLALKAKLLGALCKLPRKEDRAAIIRQIVGARAPAKPRPLSEDFCTIPRSLSEGFCDLDQPIESDFACVAHPLSESWID